MINTDAINFLCYFDVFDHPLTYQELAQFSDKNVDQITVELQPCFEAGLIYEFNGYLSIQERVEELVIVRTTKEDRAKHYLNKMPFYLKLMGSFPFVDAIGISGSLSKNVMHEDGDIDYFIVTQKGRLWLCRTFLIFFKKIFLLNSRKYFCVNYFVDIDNLEIPDENFFTAIEIAHLLPVLNFDRIETFKSSNKWSKAHVSHFNHPLKGKDYKRNWRWGNIVAFILKGKLGDRLDLYFMKLTYKRWQKKFPDFDADKFELTMRTNRGVSKHHPRNFQERVLREYQERIEKIGVVV